MSNDLVRVRLDRIDTHLSRAHAEESGAEVLDESAYDRLGRVRPDTTHSGRRVKPKTTVNKAADSKAVTESAKSTKENP